jgi:hypothetical protein
MRQLSEEPAVTPIVHGAAGIVASGHSRETGKGACVPDADAFDLIRPGLVIGDSETGARGADVRAAPALEAPIADFLPRLFEDASLRHIPHRG